MTLTVAAPVQLNDLTVSAPVVLSSFAVAAPATLPVLTFTADGQRVWIGTGIPDVVPGASPGDLYLDDTDGTLYRLT